MRGEIIREIRNFFHRNGFLEVETPLLIPANAPEDHIEPFTVYGGYLQTSPEIAMKRLLCRGYEKIFQISRCWRIGERGTRHLPEFTMLEWYRIGCDYHDLMNDCEYLLAFLSKSFFPDGGMVYQGVSLDLRKRCEKMTIREAFEKYASADVSTAVSSGKFDEIVVTEIEPALPKGYPVMLTEYPVEMAALARIKPGDPSVAERFELYAGGLELANGFSELNDPAEQRRRFEHVNTKRVKSGLPPLPLPEPFLEELSSMPPSAGIALGIDRLVMLFADSACINDVVAFTPEESQGKEYALP